MVTILFKKFRNKELVKRGISNSFIFKLLSFVYPSKVGKTYKYYKELLAKAAVNMKVENLINIKIILVTLTIILYIAIVRTNVIYKTQEILQDFSTSTSILLNGTSEELTEEEQKELEIMKEKEREIYYELEANFGELVLAKSKDEVLPLISNYVYFNKLSVKEDEDPDVLANRMYTKLYEMGATSKVDILTALITFAVAFFLPEIILLVRKLLIGQFIYGEYLQLEVNTIMVGKLEPIKVEEILTVLSGNSRYFKIYIDEIRFNYFDVKDGYEDAFEDVIPAVENKEFRYLLKALQQASQGDLKMTIENLENQRLSNKEFRNIRAQNKLKQKDLLAIMAVLMALVTISIYVFAPFGEVLSGGLDFGM